MFTSNIVQEIKDEDDIDSLLMKNCPDLLRNFGDTSDIGLEDLSLDDVSSKKKKDKKEKKEKKSSKSKKDKHGEKVTATKVKTEPGDVDEQKPPFFHPQFNSFTPPQSLGMMPPSLNPYQPLPGPFPPPMPAMMSPYGAMPPFPSPMPMQVPPNLPQPPPLPPDLQTALTPEVHSLLLSWYLAGYHTGVYQGASQARTKHKKKEK